MSLNYDFGTVLADGRLQTGCAGVTLNRERGPWEERSWRTKVVGGSSTEHEISLDDDWTLEAEANYDRD